MLYLRTNQREVVSLGQGGIEEARLEDYKVGGLMDFNDISYDDHADPLYDLAGQVVRHLQSYLSEEETPKELRCYQRDIARFVHSQMQAHYHEEAIAHEVVVSKGFIELKRSAYSYFVAEPPADYRVSPEAMSNMARYLFGGFEHCLYAVQKFESEAERRIAMILERDAIKRFKPARSQFQLFYSHAADYFEYQPDFVAESADTILILEPKASSQVNDPIVSATKKAAVK